MHLLDYLSETICYIDSLSTILEKKPDTPFESVLQTAQSLMDKASRDALGKDIKRSEFNEALFPVCVWLDEVVLNSAWEFSPMWSSNPIQKIKFHTTRGGELFYSKLNSLTENNPLREVYLYCLIKGFRGKYFRPDAEKTREAIIQEHFIKRFDSDNPAPANPLFPLALDSNPALKKKRHLVKKIVAWSSPLLLIIPIGLLTAMYMIFDQTLTQMMLSIARHIGQGL